MNLVCLTDAATQIFTKNDTTGNIVDVALRHFSRRQSATFNESIPYLASITSLNLQTAFLSPPVAMAAFYLKGVAPPHVTLNQIFAGMLPFMAIQVFAIVLLYMFPAIGMWLPEVLYK